MSKRRMITKADEQIAAIRISRAYVGTVEQCIEWNERGEMGHSHHKATPIAMFVDEPSKCALWLHDRELEKYEEGWLNIPRTAHQRIVAEAREYAKTRIRGLFEEGKYTYEQLKAAING